MSLHYQDIPSLIDLSVLRTDVTFEEIERFAEIAKTYGCYCAYVMPSYTEKLRKLLAGSAVKLGGVSGFPSGADSTRQKVDCAAYMKRLGCDEVDMVIHVGALKSREDCYVLSEIKEVVKTVAPLPVKVILECTYLTDEEIVRGCLLAVEGGCTFVKTGTGWASKPASVEWVRLMKETVAGKAKVKAAGGIRTLASCEALYEAGGERFGIAYTSAVSILKEAALRDGIPL